MRAPRAPPIRPRYEKGFWAWVERHAIALQTDPQKRGQAFLVAWLISLGFIAIGVVYIFFALVGARVP